MTAVSRRSRRRLAATAHCAALVVVLGGCGDDSPGPRDAGPADADAFDAGSDGGAGDGSPPDAVSDDAPAFDGGDAGPRNPLAGVGAPTLIREGFMLAEGPLWRAASGDLLFSDVSAGTIFRFAEPDTFEVFRMPSDGANGLAFDTEGRLLAAETDTRRVSRTLGDGSRESVVELYMGSRLSAPNDIAVRSDGTIYFTDPGYGPGPEELTFHGVFRITPDGTLYAEWEGTLTERPNGIGLSPDEATLYVADTGDSLTRAWDVAPDGSLSGERVHAELPTPDGMAVDEDGNLYVASGEGVTVLTPDGGHWGVIPIPAGYQPTNCGFGGPDRTTLYVTTFPALFRVEVPIPGAPTRW